MLNADKKDTGKDTKEKCSEGNEYDSPARRPAPMGRLSSRRISIGGIRAADRNTAGRAVIRGRLIGGRGDLLIHKKAPFPKGVISGFQIVR